MEELIYVIENMPTEALNMMLGMAKLMIGTCMLTMLLNIIGSYKMFRKAGEKGWKAIIPFYNDFIRFDLFWEKKMYIVYLAAFLVTSFVGLSGNEFTAILSILASLAGMVMVILLQVKTAAAYGKGVGMALVLMLFPFLGYMILGFGKAEYQRIR